MAFNRRGRILRMTLPRSDVPLVFVKTAASDDNDVFQRLAADGSWTDAVTTPGDVGAVLIPTVDTDGTAIPPPVGGEFVFLAAPPVATDIPDFAPFQIQMFLTERLPDLDSGTRLAFGVSGYRVTENPSVPDARRATNRLRMSRSPVQRSRPIWMDVVASASVSIAIGSIAASETVSVETEVLVRWHSETIGDTHVELDGFLYRISRVEQVERRRYQRLSLVGF